MNASLYTGNLLWLLRVLSRAGLTREPQTCVRVLMAAVEDIPRHQRREVAAGLRAARDQMPAEVLAVRGIAENLAVILETAE